LDPEASSMSAAFILFFPPVVVLRRTGKRYHVRAGGDGEPKSWRDDPPAQPRANQRPERGACPSQAHFREIAADDLDRVWVPSREQRRRPTSRRILPLGGDGGETRVTRPTWQAALLRCPRPVVVGTGHRCSGPLLRAPSILSASRPYSCLSHRMRSGANDHRPVSTPHHHHISDQLAMAPRV